ncbi:HTH-type transcriptional regulator GltR [bacterium BMS3Bbin10]|nr:HTH-type transcriptional regulator GltR [bacterium BMS3Bbin10]
MSIRLLKTFIAIASEGSFAAAADKLGLTQSAVSLQMKALEEEFRTELFDRTLRRPTINASGRELLARASEVVRLYDQLPEAVSEPNDLAGSFTFGAVNTIMAGVLPGALRRLRNAHPRLRARVVSGLSAELVHMVDRGEIDAALVSEPPAKLDPDLVWTGLYGEPLVVIAPKGCEAKTDVQLLKELPFIRFSRSAWAGRLIHKALRQRQIKVNQSMETDSLEAIALMVSRGLGVSVVPLRPIADPFPAPLVVIPFGKNTVLRSVGMVSRVGSAHGKAQDVLAEMIRLTAAEYARESGVQATGFA